MKEPLEFNNVHNEELLGRLETNREAFVKYYAKNSDTTTCDSNNTVLTPHGKQHIEKVILNAESISNGAPIILDEREWFYLYNAILMHDIAVKNFGYDHPEHVSMLREAITSVLKSNEIADISLSAVEKEIIIQIASAHGGDGTKAYEELAASSLQEIQGFQKPQLVKLAVLLRLADILDITDSRTVGVTLESFINEMNEISSLHWAKHKAIASWSFGDARGDESTIFISMLPDTITRIRPKFTNIKHSAKLINFVIDELGNIQKELSCARESLKRYKIISYPFRWETIKVQSFIDEQECDLYRRTQFICHINNKLEKEESGKPPSGGEKEKEEKTQNLIQKTVPLKALPGQQQKKTKDRKKQKYFLIGDDSYRKELDNYIARESMLIPGCFIHKYGEDGKERLRMLDWLDSFPYFQNNQHLLLSANIIASTLKSMKADVIVALNLKGARIAGLVSLILECPVLFYLNHKLESEIIFGNDTFNVAIISDCIISGGSTLECSRVIEKNEKANIIGVFCVFLRNMLNGENVLYENNINIFTINDHYPIRECEYAQKECHLFQTYREGIYERTYKKDKLMLNEE